MRRFFLSWLFIVLILLIDLYVFQAVKLVVQSSGVKIKYAIYVLYWTLSAAVVITLALLPYIHLDNWPKTLRTYWIAIVIGIFLSKAFTAIFLAVDDLRRALQWGGGKLFYQY